MSIIRLSASKPYEQTLDDIDGNIFELNGNLYVCLMKPDSSGKIQLFKNDLMVDVISFTDYNSYITASVVYDEKVYFGMANGKLYSFNGVSNSLENTYSNSIIELDVIQNKLYILRDLTNNISVFDGTSFWNVGGL